MGLEDELKEVSGVLNEDVSKLNNEIDKIKTSAYEKLDEIKQRIKNGESTGDKIKDYIVVCLSDRKDTPFEQNLRRLNDNINKYQNEQILVYSQRSRLAGCTGFGGRGYTVIDDTIQLGILSGSLDFNLGNGNIIIPTSKYVQKGDKTDIEIPSFKPQFSKAGIYEDKIKISGHDFLNLNKPLTREEFIPTGCFGGQYETVPVRDSSLRIITGNKQVELFFTLPHSTALELIRELESNELRDTEIDVALKLNSDLWMNPIYVDLLNSIGLEAPEIFRKKYDEQLLKFRLDTISHLEYLLGKEIRLKKEIKSVYDSIKDGVYSRDGVSISVVENEDDAHIYSLGAKTARSETEHEIIRYVNKAIELGLHKEDFKFTSSQLGIPLNSKDLVLALCQKYEVIIPE